MGVPGVSTSRAARSSASDLFDAGGTRDHQIRLGSGLAPQGGEATPYAAGLAPGAIAFHWEKAGEDRRLARRCGLGGFQHEESGGTSQNDAGLAFTLALENRSVIALPQVSAHLVDDENVGAFRAVGAAHQHRIDLARSDAALGVAQGVDARSLLAHERA